MNKFKTYALTFLIFASIQIISKAALVVVTRLMILMEFFIPIYIVQFMITCIIWIRYILTQNSEQANLLYNIIYLISHLCIAIVSLLIVEYVIYQLYGVGDLEAKPFAILFATASVIILSISFIISAIIWLFILRRK